jgi:lysophospholipase L1-like esterase
MKVVCIGNSIVKGFPHRQGQSFPAVLRERTGWQVINKGKNGDTTEGVLARFPADVLFHRPDKVMILTGTNDFIYKTASPQEAMENIKTMAELAKKDGIETILLTPLLCDPKQASMQWMEGTPEDYEEVNRKLEALSSLMKDLGASWGCTVVELGLEYKGFGEYQDGLHPTVEGQAWIARCIIEEILGEKNHASRE